MSLLSGIRILAIEQYGAGPFGTQALADLGAEVIKIENPKEGGDVSRQLGPHFIPGVSPSSASLYFQSLNRNKKSIALDLSSPAGREVFARLVSTADAVANNLRGDVPARLGLDYEALKQIKRDVVCCHLSAYGRTGSRASWPGYDYLVQSEIGYFSINGEPNSPPSRFGLSIVDFMAGYCLALSVVAGVLDARRSGAGRDIDVNLFDVGAANLNYLAAWTLNAGHEPVRNERSAHPSLVPCQLFPTADGWIYIMANKEKFWPVLCDELGAPELKADQRFVDFGVRHANRLALTEICDALFRKRPTAEWLSQLAGRVPCAPILPVSSALRSSFAVESDLILELEGEAAGTKVVRSPIRTADAHPVRSSPRLGESTDALLAELGYGPAEQEKLRLDGIVG